MDIQVFTAVPWRPRFRALRFLFRLILFICWITEISRGDSPPSNSYPAASHVPNAQSGWENFLTKVDPSAAKDEPESGRTAQGTPVGKRIEECFPAEPRNLFWEVDQ